MSQRLKTRARSEREIVVRRDKQRATPRMTKQGYLEGSLPPDAEKSGDWRTWWVFGCGRNEDGTPYCPDGHQYYIERQRRGAHRRSKILGRRKERRQLNRLAVEEE